MTFKGRPLFDFRPDFDRVTHGQLDDATLKRQGFGTATPWKATTKPKRKLRLPFLFSTKAEWRAFRDFVAARRGVESGFWLPIHLTDYDSSVQTAGDNKIRIPPVGLSSVFVSGEQFAFVALIDPSKIEAYEIGSITVLGGGDEQLNLTDIIAGTFDLAYSVCCGLIYGRFFDGLISYEYLSDGVVKCEVDFVELPREYVTITLPTRPIMLYQFQRGASVWRFTNYGESVVAGDELWISDNITNDEIGFGLEMISESVSINMATDRTDHPMRYYAQRGAMEKTTLTIYESDAGTLALDLTAPIYSGDIGDVEFGDNGQIKGRLGSIFRVGEQQGPAIQTTRTCAHRTYDVNCGLVEATFTTAGFVTVVGADYIEALEFGTKVAATGDPNWFALGKVRIGNEVRMCVGGSGNRLYLDLPFFTTPTIGGAVSATAGDDKRVGTCNIKFGNILNNMAFAYMPNKNPQLEGLLNPKPAGGKKS